MTEICTVRAHLKRSIKLTLLQDKHGQIQSHNFSLMAMRAVLSRSVFAMVLMGLSLKGQPLLHLI